MGDDSLSGGAGNDWLTGRHGVDTLAGGLGQDQLSGFHDDDLIIGTVLDTLGQDLDRQDSISGGAGDDTIVAGANDLVFGQEGQDTVIVSHWNQGDPAVWHDFDPTQDEVVFYDPDGTLHTDDLTVSPDPDDTAIRHILLDGAPILTLHGTGTISPSDISIIQALPS